MKIYIIDSDKDQMDPEKDKMDPDKKGSKRR